MKEKTLAMKNIILLISYIVTALTMFINYIIITSGPTKLDAVNLIIAVGSLVLFVGFLPLIGRQIVEVEDAHKRT